MMMVVVMVTMVVPTVARDEQGAVVVALVAHLVRGHDVLALSSACGHLVGRRAARGGGRRASRLLSPAVGRRPVELDRLRWTPSLSAAWVNTVVDK